MLAGGVQTVAQMNRSSGRWCCVKEEHCVVAVLAVARSGAVLSRAVMSTQRSAFTQHHLLLERFLGATV